MLPGKVARVAIDDGNSSNLGGGNEVELDLQKRRRGFYEYAARSNGPYLDRRKITVVGGLQEWCPYSYHSSTNQLASIRTIRFLKDEC